jgi:hypothetical protein
VKSLDRSERREPASSFAATTIEDPHRMLTQRKRYDYIAGVKPIRGADMPETMIGGCHCGRVRFRVTADLSRVAECNCSICRKKGFLHLIVAPEQFELLSGEDALTTYRFNTGTARHTFCSTCGIHAFYVPRSDPDKIDVNVRCLDDVDIAAITPQPFDGQHWEQSMAGQVPWR